MTISSIMKEIEERQDRIRNFIRGATDTIKEKEDSIRRYREELKDCQMTLKSLFDAGFVKDTPNDS